MMMLLQYVDLLFVHGLYFLHGLQPFDGLSFVHGLVDIDLVHDERGAEGP